MCIFLFNENDMSVSTQACNVRAFFSMNRAAKEADIQHIYTQTYESDAFSVYCKKYIQYACAGIRKKR